MGYHAVQIQSNTIGGRITCLIQNKKKSMVDGLFRSRDVKGRYSLLVLPYYMNLTSHVLAGLLHPERCFQSHSTKTAGLHPPNGRMNINGTCFFFSIL